MAVDMHMKMLAGKKAIAGESTIVGHENDIEILAWSWNMSQSGTTHSGTGGGSGKVNVGDLSFTKYIDKSTPILMKYCCTGQHLEECTLVLRKAGGDAKKGGLSYVKLTLKDCIISSVASGGSQGGDRVTENVTINFAEFHFEYTPQKKDGSGDAAGTISWNIAKNCEA